MPSALVQTRRGWNDVVGKGMFFCGKNHKDMAINNDTATVSVEINSEQAKAKLNQLQRDARRLKDVLEAAWRAGDKMAM